MDYSKDEQSLVACFAPANNRQTDIKTALADSVFTKRHPLIQPSRPVRSRNRRVVYHCNGIDIWEEKVTDQVSKWGFSFPADATLIAYWDAMNYGSALAPVGTPQNEVQTILNAGATANSYAIKIVHEGRTETTVAIAFNATAAAVKSALEALDMIEAGDIASVTGTLVTGLAVTFGGRYAHADIPALQIVNNTVTGGAITVTETTKGANKLHAISRSTSRALPLTGFIIGFEEDEVFKKHKGFACDSIIVEGANREDLSCSVELVGRADTEDVLDFVVPNCVTVNPIEVDSCRLVVDGDYLLEDLYSFRFERRNNIPTSGKGMFPWADKNIGILWRGVKPTESLNFSFYGSETHPLYAKADAENKVPIISHLGYPGDRTSIIAPNVKLKLGEPDTTFDNDLRRSVVNVTGTPHFDQTINASSRVEANISQTTTFLGT